MLIREWTWNMKHSLLPKRSSYFLDSRYSCLLLGTSLFILESETLLIPNTSVLSCLVLIHFKDCHLGCMLFVLYNALHLISL